MNELISILGSSFVIFIKFLKKILVCSDARVHLLYSIVRELLERLQSQTTLNV